MSSTDPYLVQCVSGHVFEVVPDTELEKRCQKHALKYIDALCISEDECLDCVEKARTQERMWDEINGRFGCGFAVDGNCTDDCPCKAPPTPDSPLSGQLRGLPYSSLV